MDSVFIFPRPILWVSNVHHLGRRRFREHGFGVHAAIETPLVALKVIHLAVTAPDIVILSVVETVPRP